jgi:hypothetical protein
MRCVYIYIVIVSARTELMELSCMGVRMYVCFLNMCMVRQRDESKEVVKGMLC